MRFAFIGAEKARHSVLMLGRMLRVSIGILTQPFPLEAPNSTAEVGRSCQG